LADSSFDIVSEVDHMEVDNAFNQADREIATRFDFKNTDSKIEKSGEKFLIEGQSEEKAKAVLEVFKDKLIKRQVSLKHLESTDPELSGKIYKISCTLKEGISTENAKKLAKIFEMKAQNLLRLRSKERRFESPVSLVMICRTQWR